MLVPKLLKELARRAGCLLFVAVRKNRPRAEAASPNAWPDTSTYSKAKQTVELKRIRPANPEPFKSAGIKRRAGKQKGRPGLAVNTSGAALCLFYPNLNDGPTRVK